MKPLMLALVLIAGSALAQAVPKAQTTPIATPTGARDTAIWVHPTDVSRSLIFGTDQFGGSGLVAYGLDGGIRQQLAIGNTVAVDVRYGIGLGGVPTDVVMAARSDGTFFLFTPDHDAGFLSPIDVAPTATGAQATTAALYFSPISGALVVFIADTSNNIRHYRAESNGNGRLATTLQRTIPLTAPVQGIAADDRAERFFFTLANKGLYVLQGEADGVKVPTLVDSIDAGRLAGAAGVALYFTADGGGYLIASASQASRFPVYSLRTGFPFVTSFSIVGDGGIKGAFNSKGIDVMPLAMGPGFEKGLFVAHDENETNYKLVAWDDIANATTPALAVDTRLDPRTWMVPVTDAGKPDAGKPDAGSKCTVPMVVDAGPSDGGDAGVDPDAGANDGGFDAGCVSGAGGGGGSSGVGGGFPSATGGGNIEEPKGCGCNQAGLLVPFAALAWLLRRRRAAR